MPVHFIFAVYLEMRVTYTQWLVYLCHSSAFFHIAEIYLFFMQYLNVNQSAHPNFAGRTRKLFVQPGKLLA